MANSNILVEDYTAAYDVTITGTTALLMHADNIDEGDDLKLWRNDVRNKELSVKGDDRSPAWTYQTYLYKDPETGRVAIEAVAFMAAVRKGASLITLKGNTTFKSVSQSLVYFDQEYLDFEGPMGPIRFADVEAIRDLPFSQQAMHCKKHFGFELFCKRCPVNSTRHLRVRPRFNRWSASGRVVVTDTRIVTPEVLEQMFELAGTRAGVLAWRPNSPKSPGRFGQFTAELTPVRVNGEAVAKKKSA